jgi:hypothetical protein
MPMRDLHHRSRGNNPWMAALLKTFTDGDIEAVAQSWDCSRALALTYRCVFNTTER